MPQAYQIHKNLFAFSGAQTMCQFFLCPRSLRISIFKSLSALHIQQRFGLLLDGIFQLRHALFQLCTLFQLQHPALAHWICFACFVVLKQPCAGTANTKPALYKGALLQHYYFV